MFFQNNDLGASEFSTWTEKRKREEIAKLVEGYRNGLPVGILCKMTETIAGNRKKARRHLHQLLSLDERKAAAEKETGGIQQIVKEYLI
ncbi:hypothetical protein KI809_08795 [Geobacter pelophilus]|jgi:hypothetical protein|uniref:Transposase n=1 Tax=Geoanaerobacter pelophilus TaxID=60036 RepID=A0AAW4L0D3_9BACT|nr:hypothetical protein [Geoanaerobacter pelophilus]MBT0664396.1 hypothetical protein [Geoanaerobacter pelophilus]